MLQIMGDMLLAGAGAACRYLFLCRACGSRGRRYFGLLYVLLSCGLCYMGGELELPGMLFTLTETVLLMACGMAAAKERGMRWLSTAVLAVSVFCVSNGIWQSLLHMYIKSRGGGWIRELTVLSVGSRVAALLLTAGVYWLLNVRFQGMWKENGSFHMLLAVPLLFVVMAEQTVADVLYRNTVRWDREKGLLYPVTDGGELLLLQMGACICLAAVLASYDRMRKAVRDGQRLQLLEQQTREQEVYVREAGVRYEQSRSFRHDLKNHLLLLEQLLRQDKTEEAARYLHELEELPDILGCSCKTGNPAVDVLLGSKLAVAGERRIRTECKLAIPKDCRVRDIDWCIVLANAMDNAISAAGEAAQDRRFITVTGRRQGSFYLLNVSNRCSGAAELPKEGIGISNIRETAAKYGGTVHISVESDIYSISILFVISQQEKAITQQSH